MECPYCKNEMTNGVIRCFRYAPKWKGVNGEKFFIGRSKLLFWNIENAWYCDKCDTLIVRSEGER